MLSKISRLPFICLLTFCIGHAASMGLYYADDAWFACIAKSLANGYGYSTPWGKAEEAGQFTRFNPQTGVGPTVIAPIAIGILVFGNKAIVPGISIILAWFFLLILIDRKIQHVTETKAFVFPFVTTIAVFAIFGWHIEIWTAALGEAIAAMATVLAIVSFSSARTSRQFIVSGFVFGLALNAKIITVFVSPVFLFGIFLLRETRQLHNFKSAIRSLMLFIIGSCVPIAAFEIWKLSTLGFDNYINNWRFYISFTQSLGVQNSVALFRDILGDRLESLHYRFGINKYIIILILPLMLFVGARIRKTAAKTIIIMCSLSIIMLFTYWLFLSNGWPRYVTIALIILCINYGLVLAFARWPDRLACLIAILICHWGGFSKMNYAINLADHGLFYESSSRREQDQVVRILEAKIADGRTKQIASQDWQTFADISFALKEPSVIGTLSNSSFGNTGEFIYAYNKHFFGRSDVFPAGFHVRTIFAGTHYTIAEVHP